MFFGKFLVKKNVITPEQMLEALGEHTQRIPSPLSILSKEGKISNDALIEAVDLQIKTSIDLMTILKYNDLINDQEIEDLYKKQLSASTSFGAVLVEKGIIEISKLENLLNEYIKERPKLSDETLSLKVPGLKSEEKTQEAATQQEAAPVVEEKKEEGVELNAAALESLKELGMSIDEVATEEEASPKSDTAPAAPVEISDEVKEFLGKYDNKVQEKLLHSVDLSEKLAAKEEDMANFFTTLFRLFHLINGVALVAGLFKVSEVVEGWEGIVGSLFEKENDDIIDWVKEHSNDLREAMNLLWEIRNYIETHGEDETFEADEKNKKKVESNAAKLEASKLPEAA